MTAKLSTVFDGTALWFSYKEDIDKWCQITSITDEIGYWGPFLKSRLTGDTIPYKKLMDNNQLADPNIGVAYFKNFLRPYFLKGAYNTFLYRMISSINLRKGSRDICFRS